MRRFWKIVAVDADGVVTLDGRPVRTPGRVPLTLPTPALTDGVVQEWQSVGDTVDPRAMPLTGLANAAIDRIASDPAPFAASLAQYGESDLLCYRAEAPEPLVERQGAAWDPIIAWAQTRYDVGITVTSGIVHVAQAPATIARLGDAIAAWPPFVLAGLSPVVTITGSLLLALALAEGAIDADTAWAAAHIDEAWQAEMWGVDDLAAQTLALKRREFDGAVAYLATLGVPG